MLAIWILLGIIVVVFAIVVWRWLLYSKETKEFLKSARTKKPRLTYEEFLAALRGLPLKWNLIRVFGKDCIRSIPSKNYPLQLSPLTAVCRALRGKFFFVSDLPYSTLEALDLPQGIANKIWQAEDGRGLQDAEVRRVRNGLLEAVGLSEKNTILVPP